MILKGRIRRQASMTGLAVLIGWGLLASGQAGEPGKATKKLLAVVFGAHCDAPESGAGGLILLLTRAGHEVYCAYATCFRGQRAFFGRPEAEVRREESLETFWACHDAMHRRRGAECGVAFAEAYWLVEAKPDAALLPVTFLAKKR
jgi:hypothetical protein